MIDFEEFYQDEKQNYIDLRMSAESKIRELLNFVDSSVNEIKSSIK